MITKKFVLAGLLLAVFVLLLSAVPEAYATAYSDAVLADSPVHYYRFNEAVGPSAANSGSNGTAGTYGASTGLSVTAASAPQLGTAIDLPGTDAGRVAANINLGTTGAANRPATVEFWLNVASPQTGNNSPWRAPAVIGLEEPTPNDGRYGYLRADGTLAASIGNGGSVISTFDTRGDGWHHFAFVRIDAPSTTIALYVDGELDASAVTDGGNKTTNWNQIGQQIGASQNGGRIVADLDELAIYATDLSATDVRTHYRASANVDAGPDLDFGDARIGGAGVTGMVTVENDGFPTLDEGDILAPANTIGTGFSGTDKAFVAFDQGDTEDSNTITFVPGVRGAHAADVDATTDFTTPAATGPTDTASLTGIGVGPELFANGALAANDTDGNADVGLLSPVTISFPPLLPPVGMEELTLTLTNESPDGGPGALTDLSILNLSIAGPDADHFEIVSILGDTLLEADGLDFLDITLKATGGFIDTFNAFLLVETDQGAAFNNPGAIFQFALFAAQAPEPSTVLIGILGVVGMAFLARRRRSAKR